jgi:hypothetical protein
MRRYQKYRGPEDELLDRDEYPPENLPDGDTD